MHLVPLSLFNIKAIVLEKQQIYYFSLFEVL